VAAKRIGAGDAIYQSLVAKMANESRLPTLSVSTELMMATEQPLIMVVL